MPPLPEVSVSRPGSVNFIQKEDVNQTNLRIGHLGGRIDDPDYYALAVMGELFGGGLSSRLFRIIRSDLGLAYAAFAVWDAEYDYPGSFFIRVDTKSESTVRAIQEVLRQVRRLTLEPVTPEELRVAKEGILNSFVFNFDSTGEIVRRLMTYEYYGYPRDFLERYKANIEKVTAEDVLRAAEKRIRPGDLVVLAVGRQQDFDQPLVTLGEFNTLDITIPAPPAPAAAAAPAATPETLAQGRKVLEVALRGMGGREALEGVRTVSALSRVLQVTPQGELPLTAKIFFAEPDKLRRDIVLPFGEISLVFDGERAWQVSPAGVQEMPAEQVALIRRNLARDTRRILLEAARGEWTVQYLEPSRVEDAEVEVILATSPDGDEVRLFVEKTTGHVLKKTFQAMSQAGPVMEEQYFSDFRPVGGLVVPFKTLVLQNGERAQDLTVQNYEINIELDAKLFTREGK
jgi:hypothetical protein